MTLVNQPVSLANDKVRPVLTFSRHQVTKNSIPSRQKPNQNHNKNALPSWRSISFYQIKFNENQRGNWPQVNCKIVGREVVPAIYVCQV